MLNKSPSNIRILIVEDDEDDYVLAADLLRGTDAFNFLVDWVKEPLQARALFSENRHDICLMDYRLGAEIGINLVRQALSLGFTAPIIMLTGQDNAGVEIEAAAAGAVDYLNKDHLGQEQLLRSIRYALARSEIQAEHFERVRAETANRSKSEFLAILSHEIRTPLTAIIGYTELLIHRHRQSDADLGRKLQIINRNGAHLLSLLNDTLDLSKIEAGKLEIDSGRIELGPFVMNVLSLVREMAEAKQLTVKVGAGSVLPRFIQSDAMRLRQILLNLLGNAIKFTGTGCIELQLKLAGDFLEFHVIDTGKGIGSADLNSIFTPFTQVAPGHQLGTGLGLSISQKLAEKLGGSIAAHSIEGVGSRFIVRIAPGVVNLDETADLAQPIENAPVAIRAVSAAPGSILVVDDVDDIRELICHILGEAGFKVLTVSSGEAALVQLADTRSIALVLMDLNMPGLDGYQTLHTLREQGYAMPVIALTAASLKGEREKCLSAGFSSYLPKPVTASVLLAEIEKQLDSVANLQAQQASGTSRILVIEDSPDANAAVCMLLQLSGHQVWGAHDQREALVLFEQHKPAIVLADLHLGKENGLELLKHLRTIAPAATRYFILSGESSDHFGNLPDFIEGFITKPVTLDILAAALGTNRD